jgi:hypothetical protein
MLQVEQNTALRTPADGIPSSYEAEGRQHECCLQPPLRHQLRKSAGGSPNLERRRESVLARRDQALTSILGFREIPSSERGREV